MFDDELEIVRFALALHLSADPQEIHGAQLLDEELGLDPLDLVLVVLRLEELGEVEFPVAELEGLRTVGDLVAVVRRWSVATAQDRPTLVPPAPTESGFHRIGVADLARRTA